MRSEDLCERGVGGEKAVILGELAKKRLSLSLCLDFYVSLCRAMPYVHSK